MVLRRTFVVVVVNSHTLQLKQGLRTDLLAAGVLGHSLGALRHGVLGQLTGEKETDSRLDLPAGDGGALVVVGKSGSLSRDSLEDIVDKGVHDRHGLAADASVGVHLLEHLVDVDGIAFLPLALALLVAGANSLCLAGLLGALGANFGRHDVVFTGLVANVVVFGEKFNLYRFQNLRRRSDNSRRSDLSISPGSATSAGDPI